MSHVVTLVSNPDRPILTSTLVSRVRDCLPNPAESRWLAEGIAADIGFAPSGADALAGLDGAIRHALAGEPVDLFLQFAATRRKRLLLADMDSTMIGQECIDELADFVGQKAKVSAITERAMRGEIAFEPALRERVALLAGLAAGIVEQVLAERITLTPGGRTLVATMRAHGGHTALVSGGFTVFTGPIAAMIGFDENHGNVLELDGAAFRGTVREPILGREAKLANLKRLRTEKGLAESETLAIGDGANDLDMLREAGLGVAFHAKPAVAAAAHARVDHGDLTALLYAQGYSRDTFAG